MTLRFSSTRKTPSVERVEVKTSNIDRDYARVELSIDGTEFEFSGPDAQVVGAHLNGAGGGTMFQRTDREDALDRQVAVIREAAARLKLLTRDAITEGNARGDQARRDVYDAIDWIAQGCPPEGAPDA